MKARGILILRCLGLLVIGPISRAESSPPKSSADESVPNLIQHLGDPSPGQRSAASEKLRTSTDAALRPALLDAAHHAANPEIRERAARLLCDLPWGKPGDPKNLAVVLKLYRTPLVEKRIEVIGQLGSMGSGAIPVLLRLLDEEPSDDVRWAIVGTLRSTDAALDELRKLKPASDDAPALAACAWGWQATDPDRAAGLFHQAADIAISQSSDDRGEVDAILQTLLSRAMNRGQYAEAIDLYRRHIWFSDLPVDQEARNLFVLYARHGPQPGFERDVRTFAQFFKQPEMMYVIGKIYALRGNSLEAQACYAAASAASLDVLDRLRVGEFLLNEQWFDLARNEFEMSLAMPTEIRAIRDSAAYYDLARCQEGFGDELHAAEDMDRAEHALRTLPNDNAELATRLRLYSAMADWHRLRDAAAKHDRDHESQFADALLNGGTWRSKELASFDVNIDLVRSLKSLGRKDDADRVFKEAYPLMRLRLNGAPHDADTLNTIAWFCARCGEQEQDAYRWSREAIRLAPANAAYLDTAAEAASVVGKWDEAAALETAALNLQPGDRFMTGQLARFKAKGK